MSERVDAFLDEWHRVVREKDVAGVGALLADDVTMGAPPYFEKLAGTGLVTHLLGLILHTIGDFTYHREWCKGREIALEFTGRVDDLSLQGIDLISLNADGRVQNLDVLMRPVNAVIALREIIRPQMLAYLGGASE
jgi:hypothetical protein